MTLLRFSRGSGLASAIVCWGTWSVYSHVGFKLDGGLVLDATPEFGVTIREAKDDESTIYFQILAPTPHISKAVDWAKGQVGKPYDWTSIIGFALRRDWWDDKAWFCSEIVCAAFDEARWPLLRDARLFDRITPRDLLLSTRIKPVNKGGTVDR